jgi:hypothetical protein
MHTLFKGETAMSNSALFTIEVPRAVLELHRFCSTDESRENLSRIHITCNRQSATNGHVLGVTEYSIKDESWTDTAMGNMGYSYVADLFIPGKIAKAALQGNTPKDKYCYQLEYAPNCISLVTRLVVIVGETDGPIVSTQVIDVASQEGVFPDITQVIPKEGEYKDVKEIGLDLALLDLFHRFLKRVDAGGGTRFRFTGDCGPAIASRTLLDGTETYFIIMPIRL